MTFFRTGPKRNYWYQNRIIRLLLFINIVVSYCIRRRCGETNNAGNNKSQSGGLLLLLLMYFSYYLLYRGNLVKIKKKKKKWDRQKNWFKWILNGHNYIIIYYTYFKYYSIWACVMRVYDLSRTGSKNRRSRR